MLLGLSPLLSEPTGDITIRCSCGLSYQPALAAHVLEIIKGTSALHSSDVVAAQGRELIKLVATSNYNVTTTSAAKETIKGTGITPLNLSVTAHAVEGIKGNAAATCSKSVAGSLVESFRLTGATTQTWQATVHVAEVMHSSVAATRSIAATGQLKESIKGVASTTAPSGAWAGTASERIMGAAQLGYSTGLVSSGNLRIGGFVSATYVQLPTGTLSVGVRTHGQSTYDIQVSAVVGYQYMVRCTADLVAVTQLSAHLDYVVAGAGVLTQQTTLQAQLQETISTNAQVTLPRVRFYARRSGYPLYAKLSSSVICTVQTDGHILEATCVTQENWVDTLDTHTRKVTVQKNKRAKVDATANAKTTVKTKAARTRKVVTKPHVNWVVVENKNG